MDSDVLLDIKGTSFLAFQQEILQLANPSVMIAPVTKLVDYAKLVSDALVNGDNDKLASLEEDVRKFLSDEAVLDRTANCHDYFKYHVQAFPRSSKVIAECLLPILYHVITLLSTNSNITYGWLCQSLFIV